METANERIENSAIRHAIFLERYKTGTVRRIIELLGEVDADIVSQIRRLEESYTRRRLEAVLNSIREINAKAYRELAARLGEELEEFATGEADFALGKLSEGLPTELRTVIEFASPATEILFVSAENKFGNALIQGRELSSWFDQIADADFGRFQQALRLGFVEGESIDKMVRRITGTRPLNFKDGAREVSRRQVRALVRTAINTASTNAREEVYKANEPLIKGVRWVSTLDGRTSAICKARDGKLYSFDKGPRPPAHFNCRSTTTPVLKSWRELGFDKDEPARGVRPFIRDTRKLKDIPKSARDQLVGRVRADETYETWLRKQPKGFQEEVLGPTKARLFRQGRLTLDKFVDEGTTREYTLQELRRRYPDAWRASFG
ncbi:minor capsid protein [Roseibium aggregatum]|uniref:Phage head morphogenesis protein, SPP1 gp7 family n=1 Tax=Roseibium aggregatum TaxID=187304 RepID=A0A0M6YAA9_9HYPH|nr:minor capsid protein [Roseibium aggregatum]CTQ45750.1 phage head morphogenesis protein, SPP1 gp7 family [Roseibium aggregatum]